jgi:type I restriction enzyme M protein
MARRKQTDAEAVDEVEVASSAGGVEDEGGGDDEMVLEGTIICALTGETRKDTPTEQTLQSLIEQLLREYAVEPKDMERDVRVALEAEDSRTGEVKTQRKTASLVVFEHGKPHTQENIIRAAVVAKAGTKTAAKKGVGGLEEILGALNDRPQIFGLWTNGSELAFRMRRFTRRTGQPEFTELTDIPAPDESLDDLETAERRPLRVASGDSLLRAFKRCHDYLYGNQNMRGDKAFWQLLHLIFAKILDEQQSRRAFFVGATEGNTPAGQKRVAQRIKNLFEDAKTKVYKDVFDGTERIELNDRSLTYVAGELGRYSLLSTDTDAKGTAYEAITSTTLKRERGQFFTPRNVIRMMVEMLDPQPGQKVLDPACGSGGFLIVALAHVRRRLLAESGCPQPESPLPSELKKVEHDVKMYAKRCLYGVDVDPDLRKAARMNMVMNNDGHGNIACFNSLEYGVPGRVSEAITDFERIGGGHGQFDFVLTNPPFGAKIPVDDPAVLERFDLGHRWARTGDAWARGEIQKKVPPEILFIESCYNYLKPGTGVMGIVVPNGILGNPGEQMEAVRWWMLRHLELLATVDLPAEAFLPQVSVQASCVFLRRRTPSELMMTGPNGPKQRPVFMAIAEDCGHGRRGETRYVCRPDGMEETVEETFTIRWEKGRKIECREGMRKVRVLADDLPWIAEQYRKHLAGQAFERS